MKSSSPHPQSHRLSITIMITNKQIVYWAVDSKDPIILQQHAFKCRG